MVRYQTRNFIRIWKDYRKSWTYSRERTTELSKNISEKSNDHINDHMLMDKTDIMAEVTRRMFVNIGFDERNGHNEQHGSISGFDVRLVDRVGWKPSKIKGLKVV